MLRGVVINFAQLFAHAAVAREIVMKWFLYACLSLLLATLPSWAFQDLAPCKDDVENPVRSDDLSIW